MYVKKITPKGEELIVVAFVQYGRLSTGFVPTKGGVHPGYSEQTAINYILKKDEMINEYENEKIAPIDVGEEITWPKSN